MGDRSSSLSKFIEDIPSDLSSSSESSLGLLYLFNNFISSGVGLPGLTKSNMIEPRLSKQYNEQANNNPIEA